MLKNLASMSTLNLFKAAIQFAISTLVGLYVLPSDYGLITFSLPIIQFIALITDLGLGSAIVRQPILTRAEGGSALTFSTAIAAVAGVALALSGWPIERISGLAGVSRVLAALGVAVFFSIAAGVPRALMERSLRYQRIALLEGMATITATIACVAILIAGGGIWAVVTFHVLLQAVRAVSFTANAHRDFEINLAWKKVSGLLSFGGWVLATNIITFLARNAQNLLIGFALGAAVVGLYGMAYQFMTLPLMALAWPASGVLLATLSRLDQDREKFRDTVIAVSSLTALVTFPLMAWMTFGLAWPITALFSAHWAGMLRIIPLLVPIGAMQSLSSYGGVTLLARGKARLQLALTVLSSTILVLGFVGSVFLGIYVFSVVYLLLSAVTSAVFIAFKVAAIGGEWRRYLSGLAGPVAGTAAGLAMALAIGIHPRSWLHWAALSALYAAAVLLTYALFWRRLIASISHLRDVAVRPGNRPRSEQRLEVDRPTTIEAGSEMVDS